MSDEQQQPVPFITFTQIDGGWQVDTNVQIWEWHILQIAAAIKKNL